MDAAQTLADVAAAYLLNAQAREEARGDRRPVPPQRAARPADRAAEPAAAAGAARARRAAGPALAHERGGPVRRPRPVQAGQRHPRPPGRRRAAASPSRSGSPAWSGPATRWPGSSGDEFVFLCEDLHQRRRRRGARHAGSTTRSPSRSCSRTWSSLTVTASVGMAFAGPGEEISDQLVVEADMRHVPGQAQGRRPATRSSTCARRSRRTTTTACERDLRDALRRRAARRGLPADRAQRATGCVTGVEALLRWTDPRARARVPGCRWSRSPSRAG